MTVGPSLRRSAAMCTSTTFEKTSLDSLYRCSQMADRVTSVPRLRTISSRIEVLAGRELDGNALAVYKPRCPIDRDISNDQERRRVAARATHQRAQARDELGDGERLGKVVVGAQIERLHAIVDGIARGQYQHGRTRARLTQVLQERPAAALRHHQIEHDGIVGHFAEHVLRFLAVGCDVDGKMRLAQHAIQRAREIRLILDDEYSHGFGGGVPAAGGLSSLSSSTRKSSNITVESPATQIPTLDDVRGRRSRSPNRRMPPRYTRICPSS